MEMIIEMFSYPFMVRAFTVGALVALCSALLGVSLVLKRFHPHENPARFVYWPDFFIYLPLLNIPSR